MVKKKNNNNTNANKNVNILIKLFFKRNIQVISDGYLIDDNDYFEFILKNIDNDNEQILTKFIIVFQNFKKFSDYKVYSIY